MAQIRYYGELRRLVEICEEEVQGNSVKDIIKDIGERYGKLAEHQAKVSLITVNGHNILKDKGMKTQINQESQVCFYPICGGG